ncbi:Chemotaxis protein methyltransferase Cher2 [uncultured Defluviicoccus sp.]|uniref:protein-glutamate O-methyltransferase n=1 Tax=metagenome TaxID=256318 RepID=A0A380T8G1_9ZZZZ|nr:Chemotaxis protein methyltransferase Cher2 [uncultured Defluviicoccus sp.]
MIGSADFLALQKLLQDRCGMQLTSDKLYLVASRLGPVALKLGLKSVIDLMTELRVRPRENLVTAVIEAMVTHESLFFRDLKPFEQMSRIVLPDMMRSRASAKKLRIWSAACSSGQEPYSIAMQIREDFSHHPGWRWEIVGTDISDPILARAGSGAFSTFETGRGLSPERLARHFLPIPGHGHRVTDAVRSMVSFQRHNLLEPAAHLGQFDIVFCRNVLIYFDAPTKARALDLIARQMAPDGVLFLGSADSIIGVTTRFAPHPQERGMFRLAPAAPMARTA